MSREALDIHPPRVAVVDDERQIHASIRLRLGKEYDLVSFSDARVALQSLADERFDLCLVDIHMPHLDGLTFIEKARERDPALGYVILSAFDTDENLRRAIPLQVYDFIPKPLPERAGFEARLPEWIACTRQSRRDEELARQTDAIDRDLASARLERDVELVASESARDALQQTANLLTTIHAHLVAAASVATPRAKIDPAVAQLARNLELGLKAAEATISVTESFFDSAYASRDSSPALVNAGLRHAVSIASRMGRAEESHKAVDFPATGEHLPVRGLSGIEFLLLAIPGIGLALTVAAQGSTVRVEVESLGRLEAAPRDHRFKAFVWFNRRNAVSSQNGVLILISANAPALTLAQAKGWIDGNESTFAAVSPRGLSRGLQKCRGLLGLAVPPQANHFQLVLALPT